MRKRAPFVLLALAVLIALLTWWLGRESPAQDSLDGSPPPGEAAASDERTRSRASQRSSRRRRRTSVTPAEDEPVEQAPPSESTLPSWQIVVLGPGDVPATGIPFRWTSMVDAEGTEYPLGGSGAYRLTDVNGRVWFGRCAGAVVRVESPALPVGKFELTEHETVLRVPELLPLELLVVNGQTGAPVHGAEVWITTSGGGRVRAPGHPTRAGCLLRVSPAHGGGKLSMRIRVDPPPGFTTLSWGHFSLAGTVSRFARSVRAVLVLRPETSVRVRVLEADGSPATGATLGPCLVAGTTVPFVPDRYKTDARGEAEFEGIPFLRGERVLIRAQKDGRVAMAPVVVLADPERVETVEVRLPAASATTNSTIGIGGGAGGRFGGRRGDHRNLRAGSVPTGRADVLVLRRDGTPAADTLVLFAGRRVRTDTDGRIVFERVRAGEQRLLVEEPGFLSSPRTVLVGEGETVRVTVREAAGRSGLVRVVDADGVPVPFASLSVAPSGVLPYIAMDGDVQLLDLHTDANGLCELHGLPPQDVAVTAKFGTRSANGTLGSEASLTLTLGPAR